MTLTNSLKNALLEVFTPSISKEIAVNRLKDLCKRYRTSLFLVNWDYSELTLEEIDNLHRLMLSN